MEQRTSSVDDIIMHRASIESHLIHGGQCPGMSPLEILMAGDGGSDAPAASPDAAEILMRLLQFAADGVAIDNVKSTWRRCSHVIKAGHSVRYVRADPAADVQWPFVEIIDSSGALVMRWEPAQLHSIYRPRKGSVNPSAEINYLQTTNESAALRVGTRIISLAALAGNTALRELTGAGVAQKLGVTRQAVSLTNRAMDAKIRDATGGKSGARGLRHTSDPRKGLARGATVADPPARS